MTRLEPVLGRDIAALLNPRAAVLVTCVDAAGVPNALTLAWHTPLSHEPPLLGISVGRGRHSHGLIEAAGEFTLNVVGAGLRGALEACGNVSGRDVAKGALPGVAFRPAERVGAPVVEGALAWLECRVVDRLPCGDHTLFVGAVESAQADVAAFVGDDGARHWAAATDGVLLCVQRGRFGVLGAGEVPA